MIIAGNIKIKVVIQPMSLFIERAYSWLSYLIGDFEALEKASKILFNSHSHL